MALNRALLAGYFEGTPHKLILATNAGYEGSIIVQQAKEPRP